MKLSQKQLLIVLAFFAIYVIWGTTYMFNKVAVLELPPFMLASIRFLTASALIFAIAKSSGQQLIVSKKQLTNSAIAGFLFLTLGNGLAVWALRYIDSGFAALIMSIQPLVVLLMMRILYEKKIQPMSVVGVILGIIGIYLLVNQKQIEQNEDSWIGLLMIFACIISWSYGSLFVGKADLPKNFLVNTGYQMLIGGIFLGILSLLFGEKWSSPMSWSTNVQWAMIALIVLGGIVAFTAFNYLLREVSPEKVATSTYVNPVIAMLVGRYILDEKITYQSSIAAVIILSGVYFMNTKKKLKIFARFER